MTLQVPSNYEISHMVYKYDVDYECFKFSTENIYHEIEHGPLNFNLVKATRNQPLMPFKMYVMSFQMRVLLQTNPTNFSIWVSG